MSNIYLLEDSVRASATKFIPTGTIAAINVQAALAELSNESAPKASPIFTGAIALTGTTIGLYAATPVVRAAAVTSPTAPGAAYAQAEAASAKTAIDAIILALKNIGVTL